MHHKEDFKAIACQENHLKTTSLLKTRNRNNLLLIL